MKHEQMPGGWIPRLALVLLAVTMISSSLAGGVISKYTMSDHSASTARVAKFSFDLADTNATHVVDLSGIRKPGDSVVYDFVVTSGSEVSLRYWVILALNGSMPLECSITKGGASVLSTTVAELNTKMTAAAGSAATPLVKATAAQTMTPNPASGTTYRLTVTWPADENDLDYANNSVAELKLQVLAQQVDYLAG